MDNKPSELEDGKIMQGTNDHAIVVENNLMINENTSISLVEPIQLDMDLDHS